MPANPDVDFLDKYQSSSEPKDKRRALDATPEPTPDDTDLAEADDQFVWNDNDEEGRFFGGGLTHEQSKLLELVDQFDQDDEQDDVGSYRKKRVGEINSALFYFLMIGDKFDDNHGETHDLEV
jgi:beta-catenin-like protein 1